MEKRDDDDCENDILDASFGADFKDIFVVQDAKAPPQQPAKVQLTAPPLGGPSIPTGAAASASSTTGDQGQRQEQQTGLDVARSVYGDLFSPTKTASNSKIQQTLQEGASSGASIKNAASFSTSSAAAATEPAAGASSSASGLQSDDAATPAPRDPPAPSADAATTKPKSPGGGRKAPPSLFETPETSPEGSKSSLPPSPKHASLSGSHNFDALLQKMPRVPAMERPDGKWVSAAANNSNSTPGAPAAAEPIIEHFQMASDDEDASYDPLPSAASLKSAQSHVARIRSLYEGHNTATSRTDVEDELHTPRSNASSVQSTPRVVRRGKVVNNGSSVGKSGPLPPAMSPSPGTPTTAAMRDFEKFRAAELARLAHAGKLLAELEETDGGDTEDGLSDVFDEDDALTALQQKYSNEDEARRPGRDAEARPRRGGTAGVLADSSSPSLSGANESSVLTEKADSPEHGRFLGAEASNNPRRKSFDPTQAFGTLESARSAVAAGVGKNNQASSTSTSSTTASAAKAKGRSKDFPSKSDSKDLPRFGQDSSPENNSALHSPADDVCDRSLGSGSNVARGARPGLSPPSVDRIGRMKESPVSAAKFVPPPRPPPIIPAAPKFDEAVLAAGQEVGAAEPTRTQQGSVVGKQAEEKPGTIISAGSHSQGGSGAATALQPAAEGPPPSSSAQQMPRASPQATHASPGGHRHGPTSSGQPMIANDPYATHQQGPVAVASQQCGQPPAEPQHPPQHNQHSPQQHSQQNSQQHYGGNYQHGGSSSSSSQAAAVGAPGRDLPVHPSANWAAQGQDYFQAVVQQNRSKGAGSPDLQQPQMQLQEQQVGAQQQVGAGGAGLDPMWRGWTVTHDGLGGMFFHHVERGESCWEQPPELTDVLGTWEFVPAADAPPQVAQAGSSSSGQEHQAAEAEAGFWRNEKLSLSLWQDPRQTASVFTAGLEGNLAYLQMYCHFCRDALNVRETAFQRAAIHFAVAGGYNQAVELLLFSHCDVNVPDGEGATPLHYACRYGYSPCVQSLLDAGADWNATKPSGPLPTVLHEACGLGQADAVACLIYFSCDTSLAHVQNGEGLTPMQVASRLGYHEIGGQMSGLVPESEGSSDEEDFKIEEDNTGGDEDDDDGIEPNVLTSTQQYRPLTSTLTSLMRSVHKTVTQLYPQESHLSESAGKMRYDPQRKEWVMIS
eukprot:g3298.t1